MNSISISDSGIANRRKSRLTTIIDGELWMTLHASCIIIIIIDNNNNDKRMSESQLQAATPTQRNTIDTP